MCSSDLLAEAASRVRKGDAVAPELLSKPGFAGMVALEWGRQGNALRIPALLRLSVSGPSAPDRLAALYAALRLANGKWATYPDCEECPAAIDRASKL